MAIFNRIGIGGLLAIAGEAPFCQPRTTVDPTITAGDRRGVQQGIQPLFEVNAALMIGSLYSSSKVEQGKKDVRTYMCESHMLDRRNL